MKRTCMQMIFYFILADVALTIIAFKFGLFFALCVVIVPLSVIKIGNLLDELSNKIDKSINNLQ